MGFNSPAKDHKTHIVSVKLQEVPHILLVM